MAGELGDISDFLVEGGVSNLDWLDVPDGPREPLPRQNLDIVPDLEKAWSHTDEPATSFVPNTGDAPRTMGDMSQAHGPLRAAPADILRTARLAMMQSTDSKRIAHALTSRFDTDSIRAVKTALSQVLAERGLLGSYYIAASDFPNCNRGSSQPATFVKRFAPEARFLLAKSACNDCIHRHANKCSVFHKEIVVDVPYTEEMADAVEQTQAAKGIQIQAASKKKPADYDKMPREAQAIVAPYLNRFDDYDKNYQFVPKSKLKGRRDESHGFFSTDVSRRFNQAGWSLVESEKKGKRKPKARIQAALLGSVSREAGFTGRVQPKVKLPMIKAASQGQALATAGQLAKENEYSAQRKLAAAKARPVVAMLQREMIKGRGEKDLLHALRLAFDARLLQETRSEWEPTFKEAGLYGAIYMGQTDFADCRQGADFVNRHSSKLRAIVAGAKCSSCIFAQAGRCMMYGRKLVNNTDEVLTAEVVAAVLDEHRMAGRLPIEASKQHWGNTPIESLKALHRAATALQPTALGTTRSLVEKAFYGQTTQAVTSSVTKRQIVQATQQYMNEGLYGTDLGQVLKGRFEITDLTAARDDLKAVIAEQGLQGIKYIDPTVYDDYGHGCATAARLHRPRAAVKFAKVGSKCRSCVHQAMPGTCSVLAKQLVIEPPYVNKAAEQKAVLASGRSTEVPYESLVNNGLTAMQEFQLQNSGDIDLNPTGGDAPEVTIEFGAQEVKLP
jgi:hypothetical protein